MAKTVFRPGEAKNIEEKVVEEDNSLPESESSEQKEEKSHFWIFAP